jgi:hypothetical protein
MAEQGPSAASPPPRPPRGGPSANLWAQPRVRIGLVIVLAVVAALLVGALVSGDDDDSSPAESGTGPVALSPAELRSQSESLDQPIYWAGPKQGFSYEYTQTVDGKTYVRYLPEGVDVGDSRADYLIVVTYPFPSAYSALKAVAKDKSIEIPGAGIALVDEAYPKSVHVAFPGVDYQVEVFDPSPQRSRAEATSGDIAPVR